MKLLSFGEIIWDVYSRSKQTLGGAPLNFAAYASMLGETVWLASAVGADELGAKSIERIKGIGINTEYIFVSDGAATGRCEVTLDQNGMPSYSILQNVAYDRICLPDRLPTDFDTIAFGTLALREEYNRKKLKSVLQGNRFSTVYADLNIRAPFYSRESIDFCLSHATVVKISDEELPLVTQELFHSALDLQNAVASIVERYPQMKLLVITCGAKGAVCYDCSNGKMYRCPAVTVPVVSTVGAGDSFGATFLTLYGRTGNIPYALSSAARVSAFVVSHREAIPPSGKAFIKQLLADENIEAL